MLQLNNTQFFNRIYETPAQLIFLVLLNNDMHYMTR